jgi:hypothetical protein
VDDLFCGLGGRFAAVALGVPWTSCGFAPAPPSAMLSLVRLSPSPTSPAAATPSMRNSAEAPPRRLDVTLKLRPIIPALRGAGPPGPTYGRSRRREPASSAYACSSGSSLAGVHDRKFRCPPTFSAEGTQGGWIRQLRSATQSRSRNHADAFEGKALMRDPSTPFLSPL